MKISELSFHRGALVGLLGAGVALTGCSSISEIVKSSDRPDARVTGASVEALDMTGATLNFDVDVSNPYAVALPLVNLEYALTSGGKKFVDGAAPLSGSIPAGGSRTITLPAAIAFADAMQTLSGVRPGALLPYEADLTLTVDAPAVGPIRLPLKRSGELPIPAVPEVSIESIDWSSLTLSEAAAAVKLRVRNTNQFPVDLNGLSYALALGGHEVANSRITEQVHFDGDDAKVVEIPLRFSPSDLGLAAFNMLRGDGANYSIDGAMDVSSAYGPLNLPFEEIGRAIFR